MTIKVRIPGPLRSLTQDAGLVEVDGNSVREVLENLNAKHPGIKDRLLESDGELRRFVNIYVGEEDIRFLEGLDTGVSEEEEVSIIPAIAGGAS